jgi:hypothetical protein
MARIPTADDRGWAVAEASRRISIIFAPASERINHARWGLRLCGQHTSVRASKGLTKQFACPGCGHYGRMTTTGHGPALTIAVWHGAVPCWSMIIDV